MTVRFSRSGLLAADAQEPFSALGFVDAMLRGIAQAMLQNNAYAGLLFVLGIAYNSPVLALAAMLGTVVSTATALLLAADRAQVRDGLFGFNGALVAIALLVFLQPTALTWVCVAFAAAASTFVTAALAHLLKTWSTPGLTAPFVVISWCMFLATAGLGRLEPTGLLPAAALPHAASVEGVVNAATVAAGVFNGVGQVFFQQNVVTGAVFTLGLFISSMRAGVAALAGSLIAVLVAWGLGAAETTIHAGVSGFNSVLVAIALGSVFFAPGLHTTACVLLATIATPVVAAAMSAAVQPLGLPSLTLPFVLVTWVCLWASAAFPALRRAGDFKSTSTTSGAAD